MDDSVRDERFNNWLAIGALFGGLGVMAGAFGSHALRGVLSPDRMAVFETAVRYQMLHAAALLAVGILTRISVDSAELLLAGRLFTIGITVFSGSLYVLVLADVPLAGAVTPLGGVALIVGWAVLGWWSISRRRLPRKAG